MIFISRLLISHWPLIVLIRNKILTLLMDCIRNACNFIRFFTFHKYATIFYIVKKKKEFVKKMQQPLR